MSAEQLNQLLKQAERLSAEEKRSLANELLKQAEQQSLNSAQREAKLHKQNLQMKWLSEHSEEYAGQWIALDGDRLLAHGTDSRQVLKQARQLGTRVPFIAFVEPPDALPFGGW